MSFRFSSINIVKWSSQGMLRLTPEAMNELFQPTINNIIKHIGRKNRPAFDCRSHQSCLFWMRKREFWDFPFSFSGNFVALLTIEELMVKPEVRGVRFLFLVGGFAESPMLQKAVQRALGRSCRIIIPHDVGLTILKGAVLFGLDPTVVSFEGFPHE